MLEMIRAAFLAVIGTQTELRLRPGSDATTRIGPRASARRRVRRNRAGRRRQPESPRAQRAARNSTRSPTTAAAMTSTAPAVLIALLAALRPRGWRVPAGCVAVAALLFGIGSLIDPDIAASGGRAWG